MPCYRSPAIATITRARNKTEADPLIESLHELNRLGLPIFAADAGSTAEFLEAVDRLGNIRLIRDVSGGLVPQVKAALSGAAAAGHDLLIYTEPDKRDFFSTGMKEFVEEALLHPDSALSIAARDERGISTFPAGQQAPERAFNRLASELIMPLPDLLYGPLALHSEKAARYAGLAPDRLGWGWRIYVIGCCALKREKIISHVRPFSCPDGQRNLDETLYRPEQLGQNIEGLRLAIRDSRD